ncbi:diaminopimelate decarboxylase [Verminephrobacter eiseniae]|uniref:Diaminopimelate decarboxylase n=1 Tax=Verminephrobacter eiseniae (strain EF01-2) TaxID=391735 RepID=A1WS52_VEREI|nr:diaminopimelate decarboxylase [Verminephrobacter eiseniae]ABM60459.1 diaminopimelate decarboxylase [Verminephrobacter eiseniae EF01-2]MCW5285936.1 diaminopimelate decarboxylase [Verminephrobacter eiseniae]MCW5304234.1 diaminopimelate decarboxylase [Verminephrobacter eiseniae]MCW8182037.1 diaminopimelate decarboxylase [Verminephrobacter eiseniae]MCW8191833.1 diaminopimelate decarboxylase [Verminephrobacter eiseniae]
MSSLFSPAQCWSLADRFATPLWVYDAATIVERIARLSRFDTIRFAQKACSNIHILALMRAQGVLVDAVSRGEILRALAAGYQTGAQPAQIVFTADLFDAATLACVIEHRVPVNAGSMDMLHQLGPRSPGHAVWLRINPGFGHGHSHKTNTGGEHSKHGIWHTDLPAALAAIRQHGLDLVGLHMHIGSGVDYRHLAQVCDAMVALVRGVRAAGHDLRAISAGGGLSVPYRSGDPVVDTAHYHGLWEAARQQAQAIIGHPLTLEIEPGRYLVAESGVLLAAVCATKQVGSNHFVLLDAGFNELLRPSMYGSYHAMSLLRRDGASAAGRPTVVAGPLCEAGDVFTQSGDGLVLPRDLPPAEVGDLLLIHDTGAYGATMSSNYNTRPLSAEALVEGAQARLIRRRQTVDELLALERGL